jgi:large subunit ribosomal protein L17
MRHKVSGKRLGRPTDQRLALLRGLVRDLFLHGQIETTLPKAKEARRVAEKILRQAKNDTLHSRRMVRRLIQDEDVIHSLFTDLADRYAEREGGFTQVIPKAFPRRGDGSRLAVLRLTD